MRKLLVLGAAIVAVLSLATLAQGKEYESSHVWFFGSCENPYNSPDEYVNSASFLGGGCRGIGLFLGDWDNESIAERVSYEAMEEFGGFWEVDYLKAINIFGASPITGGGYGCGSQDPISITPRTLGGGLWIAIFSVVPCEPVEVCVVPGETLLAVAYIDNNTSDGGYNPCVDTLIAKFVDVDVSGTANDGDEIVMNQYPLDFAASSLGSFGVTEHVLSSASVPSATTTTLKVIFGGNRFEFTRVEGQFEFYSEWDDDTPSITTYFSDTLGVFSDGIQADGASGSLPQTPQTALSQSDTSDNAFIDVEIYIGGICSTDTTTAC